MDYLNKTITEQAKGLAILCVIFGHLTILQHVHLPDVFIFGGAWGVAVFLFLSGFGLAQSYLKNGTESFLTKRIGTVLFPYALVTACQIVIDTFLLGKIYGLKTVVLSIIGLDFKVTVDPTMWYIGFILLWYLAFYVIFKMPIPNFIKAVLIFVPILLLKKYIFIFSTGSGAIHYLFEFPLGVLVGLMYPWLRKAPPFLSLLLLWITTAGCGWYFFGHVSQSNQNFYYYSISNLTFAFGITALFAALSFAQVTSPFLIAIGSISYPLYLLEGVFFSKYNLFAIYSGGKGLWVYLVIITGLSILLKVTITRLTKLIYSRLKAGNMQKGLSFKM